MRGRNDMSSVVIPLSQSDPSVIREFLRSDPLSRTGFLRQREQVRCQHPHGNSYHLLKGYARDTYSTIVRTLSIAY